MTSGVEDLGGLEQEAEREIAAATTSQALVEVRAGYLGRKGSISSLLRQIGSLEGEERARVGQAVNAAKERIESLVQGRDLALRSGRHERELSEHRLDVSLPGSGSPPGHLHPLTHIEREMFEFF